MMSEKMTDKKIKDAFKKAYKDTSIIDILDINIIEKIYALTFVELGHMSEKEKPDGSFDSAYVQDFINRYKLDIPDFGDGKEIFNDLLNLSSGLWGTYRDSEEYKAIEEAEIESLFSKPKITRPEVVLPELLKNIPHGKNEQFARKLKEEFNEEFGVGFRLLLEALVKNGVLSYRKGQLKLLHDAIKKFFNRDIGSYEIFRRTDPNSPMYRDDLKTFCTKIENILKKCE